MISMCDSRWKMERRKKRKGEEERVFSAHEL